MECTQSPPLEIKLCEMSISNEPKRGVDVRLAKRVVGGATVEESEREGGTIRMAGGIRAEKGEMCWRVEPRSESPLCALRNVLLGCTFSHLDSKLGHMVSQHIVTSNRKHMRGRSKNPPFPSSHRLFCFYGPEIN